MGEHLRRRSLLVGASVVLCSLAASGKPPAYLSKAACTEERSHVEELEKAGRLREAKAAALACSGATCREPVGEQCRAVYQRLEYDVPSVIPLAVDAAGQPLVDVEVHVDNELLTTHLDGRALLVDPGLHEFSFAAKDGSQVHQKLMLVQGQKNVSLSVTLPAAGAGAPSEAPAASSANANADASSRDAAAQPASGAAPASAGSTLTNSPASGAVPNGVPAEQPRHRSMWPYVIGGVGAASVAASVTLVTWGHYDNALLDRCAPNCQKASVDRVKNLYLGADVTLGVGVAALGVATWLYFSYAGSAEPTANRGDVQWNVAPQQGGAFGSLEGRF